MPKDYLTSGDFAALRGVNLNSLRYYEKLGLLVPAVVDPETKYRYFRLEQLSTLDTILFLIEVGLPLKSLKNYLDKNGDIDRPRILRDGQSVMEKKIAAMRERLETIEFDLDQLEQNRWCNAQKGIYHREISERFFVVEPFTGEWEDAGRREKQGMDLFRAAQKAGMLPTFPAGFTVELRDEPTYAFFVQVLRPSVRRLPVVHIESGTFDCIQVELFWGMDIPALIRSNFPCRADKPVILTNILRDTHGYSSRWVEIQSPSA